IIIITYVQIIRIQDNRQVECISEEQNGPLIPYIHEVTISILKAIENQFNIKFNQKETLFFSQQFLRVRVLTSDNFSKKELINTLESKYTIVVQQLLNDIRDEFQINLTQDDKLFVDLVLHIRF